MSDKSSNLSLLRNPVVNRLREKPDSPVTKGLTFLLKSWRCVTTRPVNRVINLERLLCGGENGLSARQYAEHTGNFLRPSTPFARSPHVRFLEQYKEVGDEIFRPEVFRQTAYFANAVECMSVMGQYFTCTREEQVEQVARGFVARFRNEGTPKSNGARAIETSGARAAEVFSKAGAPARVQPVKLSDCYTVVDGNHRLAIAYVRGERAHLVRVEPPAVLTPLQRLILDYAWCATRGERELYQPVESPELESDHWILVRRCADRLEMMKKFLAEQNLMPPRCRTYLDVACSYGWFVSEFGRLGFDARGVEIDWAAVEIGRRVYGLKPCQVTRSEVVKFMGGDAGVYDVVSCFSLLHHFVMGHGSIPAEEMLGLLDRATGTVLFLDTGESHEAWVRDALPEWDADHIERWLRENSGFTKIYRLGTDTDDRPPYSGNYGRTLFACMR